MYLQINTTPRNIQYLNAILGQAIREIEKRKDLQEHFNCSTDELLELEQVRHQIIDSFIEASIKSI